MYDYHLHSKFSPDGNQTIADICHAAIKNRLKEIAITDHLEIDSPTGWGHALDYNQYKSNVDKNKKRHLDKLNIAFGIEIGAHTYNIGKVNEYINTHQFDFIIASVHYLNNKDISSSYSNKSISQQEFYRKYLEEIYFAVTNLNTFSVLGHIDFICRYVNYANKMMHYNDYSDIIDQIFKVIISKGYGIEINTAGVRNGLTCFHPNLEILQRYKELGGEILTVGSDAHFSEHVGFGVYEAIQILRDIGFKYISTYKNNIPKFNKL